MPLNTEANALPYDDFYEALIDAHQGLSLADSHAMNARLVLLLANHIGDLAILREALRLARAGAAPTPSANAPLQPPPPVHAA